MDVSKEGSVPMLPQLNEHPVWGTGMTRKLLRLLEPLNQHENGARLYQYIEQTLASIDSQNRASDEAYAGLLPLLLTALDRQLPTGSPLKAEVKLLEVRLTPPYTQDDLAELRKFLNAHMDEFGHTQDNKPVDNPYTPLIDSLGVHGDAQRPREVTAETHPGDIHGQAPEPEPMRPPPERRTDGSYRRHLDEKRKTIQRIQYALSQQITACTRHNILLGALLEKNLEILQGADDWDKIMATRAELTEALQTLITDQQTVAQKLDQTKAALGEIEADSQQLSDELTRIHLLSLTDDLTSLPNRRAFMRRLQDEASRVQRYGNPLSLALIDLDGFKDINDKLGHAAGDEVLRVMAAEILSIFRHHDLVSRYGGEEFAVLLPNTHFEGALRALRKVQKRAQEGTFQHNDTTLPLPTFSAGLTVYNVGESPEYFIQRADHALYRAKHLGRNRIELDRNEMGVPDEFSSMA